MRKVAIAAICTVAILAVPQSSSWAQKRAFAVAGYTGSLETTLRSEVIPHFEKTYGVWVNYLFGNSAETVERLRNLSPDVIIADDWAIERAIQMGFCGKIDGLNVDDLQPGVRLGGGKAIALGLAGTGIMYNTDTFRDKGWRPPSSWNDLKDPKYRKMIAVPPITNVYGLEVLVMLARANGGGE